MEVTLAGSQPIGQVDINGSKPIIMDDDINQHEDVGTVADIYITIVSHRPSVSDKKV